MNNYVLLSAHWLTHLGALVVLGAALAGCATQPANPYLPPVEAATESEFPAAERATAALSQPDVQPHVEFVSVAGGRPGEPASATVQTIPGVSCMIRYVTALGTVARRTKGLVPAVADPEGRASWSWVIASNATPGTGTVTVMCVGKSASAPIQIRD